MTGDYLYLPAQRRLELSGWLPQAMCVGAALLSLLCVSFLQVAMSVLK